MPRRSATFTAAVRSFTFSFARMFFTYLRGFLADAERGRDLLVAHPGQ
jgi:hypothetical protein